MGNSEHFRSFTRDILALYCKTGVKSIEDIFIRLSQSLSANFSDWLRSNKNIRNELRNPEIYDSLVFLSALRNLYPDQIKMADIVKASIGTRASGYIPFIISFIPFLSNESVKNILLPFEDIINTTSSFKLKGKTDIGNVYDDLLYIKSKFDNRHQFVDVKKQTLKQKKEDIFIYLLQRFSDELALAAEHSGFTDLAKKFRERILAKPFPMGLGQYIEFSPISDAQMRLAKKMASHVMKYPDSKFQNYNHDFADLTFLQSAGVLTEEDVVKLKDAFERQKNAEDIIKGLSPVIDSKNNISLDKRLNPDYLYMLSMFFVFMQKDIGVPDMIFPL